MNISLNKLINETEGLMAFYVRVSAENPIIGGTIDGHKWYNIRKGELVVGKTLDCIQNPHNSKVPGADNRLQVDCVAFLEGARELRRMSTVRRDIDVLLPTPRGRG